MRQLENYWWSIKIIKFSYKMLEYLGQNYIPENIIKS